MATMDALNQRFGRGTVCIANAGFPKSHRVWTMKQERLSPHYTTRWTDVPIVRAG
jgi:DNA polymerase V